MGTPSPVQQKLITAVIEEGIQYPLYGGARGGGKSWAVRRLMLELLLRYDHSNGLILRRSYPELQQNHVRALLHELPKNIAKNYNATSHTLTLPNGSVLQLGYCSRDADLLRYQGCEYDFIAIDEAQQFQEYWYDCIRASLRSPRGYPTVLMLAANPGGVGHNWIKRGWIEECQDSKRMFIPARVYDNPVLMQKDPEYVKRLEAIADEQLRRAWLDGDWDVFAGQYFSELRKEIHGFSGPPPHGWTFRTIDYGEVAPAAVYWVRVDAEGRLWIYRELYAAGLRYSQLAQKIKDMTFEDVRYTVASPDIFAKSKGTGEVGADTLQRLGVPVVRADNNRVEGWRRMKEYLAPPNPMMRISLEDCPHWWRTVPSLVYDEHNIEDVAPEGEDHAAEATRYAVMSRPAKYIPEIKAIPKDSAAYMLQEIRGENYANL